MMITARLEVGDLVLAALEMALEQEGECRLVSSGARAKGLLPGGRATSAKNQAKEQCVSSELGLFTVRLVEEGKGSSIAKVPFVTITRRGIEMLFERRTPTRRRELLDHCANPHKEAANDVLQQVTTQELKEIDSERELIDKRETELRQFVKKMVEDQFAALERQRMELERQRAERQELVNVASEPDRRPPDFPRSSKRVPLRPSESEGDLDFQRDVCRELVFAWQDNPEPDARAALEVVMMNSGLERVGEIGETVAFDNRDHHTDSNLLPGHPAVIIEPGWQLISPRGTLLIAPAQVATAESQGVDHAPHA